MYKYEIKDVNGKSDFGRIEDEEIIPALKKLTKITAKSKLKVVSVELLEENPTPNQKQSLS